MKVCPRCAAEKADSDFPKDKTKRDGLAYACRACTAQYKSLWDSVNRPAAFRRYSTGAPQAVIEERRLKKIEQMAAYRQHNREKVRMACRAYKAANKGKVVHLVRKREERIAQATPPWADMRKIEEIYIECASISDSTGVKHHVDHVIPLKGRHVCGLHVPENLRPIPAIENLRKYNKF